MALLSRFLCCHRTAIPIVLGNSETSKIHRGCLQDLRWFWTQIEQVFLFPIFWDILQNMDLLTIFEPFLTSSVQVDLCSEGDSEVHHREIVIRFNPKRRGEDQQLGIHFRIENPLQMLMRAPRTSADSGILPVFSLSGNFRSLKGF